MNEMDSRLHLVVLTFLAVASLPLPLHSQPPAPAQSNPPGSSSSSSPHTQKPAPAAAAQVSAGSISNGNYRNTELGFSCRIPPGWVLRTEEMNAPPDHDEGDEPKSEAGKAAAPVKAGRVLLAAFARPPQARGQDVNASILIAAESAAAYPGLKDAAQYFQPVAEVANAQGLSLDDDPYEFAIGNRKVVRGDFQKDVGTQVMRQSTLVVLARGYALSFTFIGGTEDEVEDLVQGLSFAAIAKPAK